MQLQQFEQYLKDCLLEPNSIKIYSETIKEFLNKYPEQTIEQINHFVAVKETKRQAHARYAIKKYLIFIGREEDYSKLHKPKTIYPIREKVFLTKEQAYQIINHIKNPLHKAMAILQYNTGARISEIITLKKSLISRQKINEFNVLRFGIRGKGNVPRYVYVIVDFWKYIQPYYESCRAYPFMDKKDKPIPALEFWDRVRTIYKRYYESLKAAAKECGLNIGTHDLRRSFADDLRKETDIFHVQKTLGHKSIDTTTRYLKVSNEEIANAMLNHQKDFYKPLN